MEGRDFIITSLQSWDIPIGSNAIDIAKEISKKNRVLYVNTPLDQMTLLRNKRKQEMLHRLAVLKKKAEPIRKISETFWVIDFPFSIWSVNGLPDGFLFDYFNRLNNKKIYKYVRKVAEEIGFKDFIHFIDNDIYRSQYAKEYLGAKLSVYYYRDNLQAYKFWQRHVGRVEPLLIAKSDLVICNSSKYANFAKQFNTEINMLGQGVDISAYDHSIDFEIPEKLISIPEPRIGYIGDINSLRLDPDLVFELAKSKPKYSFVMIGGEDDIFANHQLHSLDNVYFLGRVPKDSVPAFMAGLQVCMNPQKLNEITIGNYPRKIDEYLALGKPVIATKTEAMDMFSSHTYLCSNLAEYQDAVERSLLDNSEESQKERIRFAQSHSWENNVQLIYDKIGESLQKK